MIKPLFFSAAMCAATFANADAEFCESLESAAKSLMKARQTGVEMSAAMKAAEGSEYLSTMVVMAYEEPRWSAQENKRKATQDFSNLVYLECHKATTE